MSTLYDLIHFPTADNGNGALTVMQTGAGTAPVPFPIERVFVIRGMGSKGVRGDHTHHKTEHVLVALSGSCTITLDNGREKAVVKLDKPDVGLVLHPYVWHTMQDFAEGTILMALASTDYDEKDYIRSYEEFLGHIKRRQAC